MRSKVTRGRFCVGSSKNRSVLSSMILSELHALYTPFVLPFKRVYIFTVNAYNYRIDRLWHWRGDKGTVEAGWAKYEVIVWRQWVFRHDSFRIPNSTYTLCLSALLYTYRTASSRNSVGMSITQGGPGFPFFAPCVYDYVCGKQLDAIVPTIEDVILCCLQGNYTYCWWVLYYFEHVPYMTVFVGGRCISMDTNISALNSYPSLIETAYYNMESIL